MFFLGILLGCITMEARAQTIPWATQQPEWIFPIYFENGNQEVDTVYIAYDFNSSNIQGIQSDSIYGEEWITVDTSKFHAYFTKCCNPFADTVIKVNVSNAEDELSGTISLENIILPLVMKWDVSLFRSNALPFPQHGSAPRAEAIVHYVGSVLYIGPDGSLCSPIDPLFITDSVYLYVDGCLREDTALFFDYLNLSPNSLTSSIEISIREWGVYTAIDIENQTKSDYFYPNPTKNYLNVGNSNKVAYVYDTFGRSLLEQKIDVDGRLNVSSLPTGIYFIQIGEDVKKFVITR